LASAVYFWFLREGCGAPCVVPSFPTRRSSDLAGVLRVRAAGDDAHRVEAQARALARVDGRDRPALGDELGDVRLAGDADLDLARSEEHTSELQSRENLVCRLLLEKKNTKR